MDIAVDAIEIPCQISGFRDLNDYCESRKPALIKYHSGDMQTIRDSTSNLPKISEKCVG